MTVLVGCVFEKTSVLHAVGSPVGPAGIVNVGGPSENDGAGFDGILWRFRFETEEGVGTVDTGIIITMYRSFDGVTVDDQHFDQFAIAAANIGEYPNTWVQTAMYPAVPGESGLPACGYAVQPHLVTDGGDRTIVFSLIRRRWRWKAGL